MFDIGWSEILVIAVVAIVVVGPKDLPPMLRAAGRMVSKLRKTAGEFQSQFNEALREAELDGVKESIDELRGLNPINQIKSSLDPIATALAKPEPIAKPAPAPVPPPINQPAQLATDADIEPASPPVESAPVTAPAEQAAAVEAPPAKPKRAARKPKEAAEVDGSAAEPAKPARKPRAAKSKAANVVTADADAAPKVEATKPRASRSKAAKPAADAPVEAAVELPFEPANPPPEERSA